MSEAKNSLPKLLTLKLAAKKVETLERLSLIS